MCTDVGHPGALDAEAGLDKHGLFCNCDHFTLSYSFPPKVPAMESCRPNWNDPQVYIIKSILATSSNDRRCFQVQSLHQRNGSIIEYHESTRPHGNTDQGSLDSGTFQRVM